MSTTPMLTDYPPRQGSWYVVIAADRSGNFVSGVYARKINADKRACRLADLFTVTVVEVSR